ncbi:MAG: YajQ family cyclic di-GMP-binding protein [Gammaproteobacteria bacterium]|nr:YajQ family cyclic di-GMP-binding protein [Gammaproteobacteria bacterium]
MPSFDIVSEVDTHEVTNAVDQTNREIGNRFDFKGTGATVEQGDTTLTLKSENEFQIKQMLDILYKKMAKRGIDIAALAEGEIESSGNKASLAITVRQGIDQDTARKIIKLIKETRLKVQASIQGEKVRVNGKKRDDLQEIIAMLRDASIDLPLQHINFRD